MNQALLLSLVGLTLFLSGPGEQIASEDDAIATIERLKGTVVRDNNRPGRPVTGVNL